MKILGYHFHETYFSGQKYETPGCFSPPAGFPIISYQRHSITPNIDCPGYRNWENLYKHNISNLDIHSKAGDLRNGLWA